MTTIGYKQIKEDILGEKKDIFNVEFPGMSDTKEYKHFTNDSKCGTCTKNFFNKFFRLPGVDEKLKNIYGEGAGIDKNVAGIIRDVVSDQTIPSKEEGEPTPEPGIHPPYHHPHEELKVHRVPVDVWDDWYENNCATTASSRVVSMNTFFNPLDNTVVVSLTRLVKNQI